MDLIFPLMALTGLAMLGYGPAKARFLRWHEPRQRARERTFVASKVYRTNWTKDGVQTGRFTDTIVSFWIDGNGRRFSTMDHPDTHEGRFASDDHDGVRHARHNWREFGDLPDGARRPDPVPKGKLVPITGGKAS